MEASILLEKELEFLSALVEEGVEFMIVGLAAATLQGAPVVTQDIDLWFRELSHPGIKQAARKVGSTFIPSFGFNPPMLAGDAVRLFDIVTSMSGLPNFEVEYNSATQVEFGDLKVKILPLDRIIHSKREANREKDRLVLPVLERALIAILAESAKE